MISRELILIVLLCAGAAWSQSSTRAKEPDLPPGPLQQKARTACLECHDASIIVQQRLDRRTWAKVMEKMVRWGAVVAPADKEALVDYFATHFGPEAKERTPSGNHRKAGHTKDTKAARRSTL